jgi:hypothetical protein
MDESTVFAVDLSVDYTRLYGAVQSIARAASPPRVLLERSGQGEAEGGG